MAANPLLSSTDPNLLVVLGAGLLALALALALF
jgi:hypothetical protein